MNTLSSSSDRNPVEELAAEFLDRKRRGERPALEEYCRRYPELADEIRELFPLLIRMEDLRSDGSGGSTGGVAIQTTMRPARLGDFRILRELGRGGMGVVYEAEQESLGRRVALKVLPDAALTDARQVLRFRREAKAAARLHHTNIVPVFGVGQQDGYHYYVMQLIPGMGLDAVLQELRRMRTGTGATGVPADRVDSRDGVSIAAVAEAILTGRFSMPQPDGGPSRPVSTATATVDLAGTAPAEPATSSVSPPGASSATLSWVDGDGPFFRSAARIGLQVAEALEYANRQGVLHRDIKPSNLLLDPQGNVWVADFGLAKAADTEDLTHSGDIVGTVRYMAPERFAGKCDARSDVYALGLTLYELLALRPAFEGADRQAIIHRVINEAPEPLRKLVPHLPRDLETIIAKAISREPAGRYASAAALAEDLSRFLEDRPIKARPVGKAEQAWRWARRNPAVASLAAGLLSALVVGLAAVTWEWRQAVANLTLAESANRKSQNRFALAMEAVRAFTTGASEDVILKEQALEGLRKKLLGQSQSFYEKLRESLEGENDRASRAALAEALVDAGMLHGKVGSPQKALEAYRQALVLLQALMREQPSDPTTRRDIGRSHLAVASVLGSLTRLGEARAEVRQARAVIGPLARERPGDGGVRRLEAECEALDGSLIEADGRLVEGLAALGRARAMYEKLIEDDPPYTLPTAADGPTEYRRGLAEVLAQIATSFYSVGEWGGETLKVRREQREILKQLTTGRFLNDQDWRLLAKYYSPKEGYHQILGSGDPQSFNDAADVEQSLKIFQRLAAEYPTVTSYKLYLASCLLQYAAISLSARNHDAMKRRCISDALALLRPLTREQKHGYGVVDTEVSCELALAGCNRDMGRPDEAARHFERALALGDELARAYPDQFRYQQTLVSTLFDVAQWDVCNGHPEKGLQDVRRLLAIAKTILRDRPELRRIRAYYIAGSLTEAFILVKSKRPAEATQAVERADASLDLIKPPLFHYEQFCVGAKHAFWYLLGRPPGPGRPAEPPGFREHSDRAVAELTQVVRGRYQFPTGVEMVARLLPDRPELQLLVMDQHFPNDPFMPDLNARDDGPSFDVGGSSP
jgi:serine/threonine-protein kinase